MERRHHPGQHPQQEMKPDFTVTAARDAQPSSVGAHGSGEAARRPEWHCYPGLQLWPLLRLFCEADRRGEIALLHTLSVLVAASDGFQIRFVRIWTGAAPPGSSFMACSLACPS